jgi:hypothetical protein
MKGFAHLDSEKPNMGPLKRRMEVKREGLAPEAMLDDSKFRDADGNLDQTLLAIESYCFSGFMIEMLWEDMKKMPDTYSVADTPRIPIDENFWKNFADRYIAHEGPLKQALSDRCQAILARPEESLNLDERMMVHWFWVKHLQGEQLGVPSFTDLFSIYTRLARVANEKFKEDFGHEPSREEYTHMLTHESFRQIMEQLMMNSRFGLHPVMGLMEGNGIMPNTDDTSRIFTTEFFEIRMVDGKPILAPKEEQIQKYRAAVAIFVQKIKEKGQNAGLVLRCPVIYTGKFKEMVDWLNGEFTHHYLDQKYSR